MLSNNIAIPSKPKTTIIDNNSANLKTFKCKFSSMRNSKTRVFAILKLVQGCNYRESRLCGCRGAHEL
ncbi:hypothetical protein XELAEV_18030767mg [Xenopus laevis]|uniref:Uncharacterized protein n=1 Tax=Xenopus laevis TaxID=8355 RepID=A0A974CMX2_XENLA|nr:hypothetical protein XELAEV_18030767mg [Xenopus laevis]